MNHSNMVKLAIDAIERHIGDVAGEAENAEEFSEHAYTIALDALVDHGLAFDLARPIAQEAARCFGS